MITGHVMEIQPLHLLCLVAFLIDLQKGKGQVSAQLKRNLISFVLK